MAERKSAKAVVVEAVEEPWHLKYRPTKLDDVVGQKAAVASLRAALKAKARQHTYFFTGPSGVGKTTLARIMAVAFGAAPSNHVEVDAASNSSVDNVRELLKDMRYQAIGDMPGKAFIIDECHRLSAQAWDAMLLSVEDAPEHVFFFFCSSVASKIPKAMLTRGPVYDLKPVGRDDMLDVLAYVVAQEKLDNVSDRMLDEIEAASGGSMRQALVFLAMVAELDSDADIRQLLDQAGEAPAIIDLCRQLVRGPLAWKDVQRVLAENEALGAEGIRIMVTAYFAKVASGCSAREAPRVLDILAVFSKPCNATDKLAPIYLAFGEFVS